MILLDTDVFVDVLRGYPPAVAWLTSLGSEMLGVPGLVAMELLQDCSNRKEQSQMEAKLRPYCIYWPNQTDCNRAYKDYARRRLSHGLGILDVLIAETAVGMGVPLATFDTKHYGVISALRTIQPYARDNRA